MNSFFCSWSGGKDSCLSLYKAISKGGIPKFLLTTCIEEGGRSRSHGLSSDILQAQSSSLNIPLLTINTSWFNYRNNFIRGIYALKEQDSSITRGVFGDIDIEVNGQWEKEVCQEIGIEAYLPLWKMERKNILQELLEANFKAMIVAINPTKLNPKKYLGRIIDKNLIEEFESINIDLCGENGEYHTVVFDGPIFSQPLFLEKDQIISHAGYYFLDLKLSKTMVNP